MAATNDTGALVYNLVYTDTTAITVGYKPPNSIISSIQVLIGTDFEAGVIDIGDATTANQYANDVDATAAGSATVTLQNVGVVDSTTAPTAVTAIYVPGSTGVAQGSAYIVVNYVQL